MVHRLWQIVSIALLIVTSCGNNETWQVEKRNIPVEFQTGDIAFRRGVGAASRAVLLSNHRGSFSHVGVIVQQDSQWMVVHEVPYEGKTPEDDKIYCEQVSDFFNTQKAASGAVYRMQGMDSAKRSIVYNFLMRQLERELPFDHDYNLADSTSQYCSELVWRSYLDADIDLSQGRRTRVYMPPFAGEHIMPADIELNETLELLYRF